MTVRCKMECRSVTKNTLGYLVDFYPVSDGSDENKKFYKYTPSGCLKLETINESAGKHFEPGKSYYIDITEANGN